MAIRIPSYSLQSILLIPYFILIIAGLTVPSDGGHGLFSVKSLSFIATSLSMIFYVLLNKKLNAPQFKIIGFLLCSLSFFMIWLGISIFHGETPSLNAFDQFKIFWLTISVAAISIYLVSVNAIPFKGLLKTAIYVNFAYSFVKVVLVTLHLLGWINIFSLMDSLGMRFMSMQIIGGLFRFQTSNDIATPYLLFFFLQAQQYGITWGKKFRILYIIISIFSIFLSFSRFLIFIAVLAVMLHAWTLRLSTIIRALPMVIILCVSGLLWIGMDNISAIAERRLLSKDNYVSDVTRTKQIVALLEEHELFPLFGKGLGGYAPKYIRDETLLHSYEVQWVAFLMQFGWIGITLILCPLGLVMVKILSHPLTKHKIVLGLMFLCWLFSGFTNPFLISLTSGIIYGLFYLAGKSLKDCNSRP